MKTKTYNVYKFDELPEESQQKVLDNYRTRNVDYAWWEWTYEDAANVGIEILSFDEYSLKAKFTESPKYTIFAIWSNHGKNCETYKTAQNAYADWRQLKKTRNLSPDEFEEEYEIWSDELLKSLSEDYRIMLRNECDFLTSDECLREFFTDSDDYFTLDGRID